MKDEKLPKRALKTDIISKRNTKMKMLGKMPYRGEGGCRSRGSMCRQARE
jgi:hypothetical protein